MRKIPILLVGVSLAVTGFAGAAEPTSAPRPKVVVALIDTGINPYAPAFRDDSDMAKLSPSSYIPDYPPDCPPDQTEASLDCAIALNLHLNEPTLASAFAVDKAIWGDPADPDNFPGAILQRQLYYIPGTKIIGATSFGAGGRFSSKKIPNGPYVTLPATPLSLNSSDKCPERLILDDFGHGTMTASRSTGAPDSLAPTARVVMIEGLGADSSTWAANQPWIDVQSNSWGSLTPAPADRTDMDAFTAMAQKQMVMVASGNGIAFSGFAPTPTELDGLGAPGVVLVGGHDNGHVSAWSGAPAHVVADAFAGMAASNLSLDAMAPQPMSCCTSAASPYAAGGAAAILLRAREILGDARTGMHDGYVAQAPVGHAVPSTGPLSDGKLTLGEWRELLLHTAQARPLEHPDDGDLNYMGSPGSAPKHPEYGIGDNPFCEGCTTLPLKWADVPAAMPAYESIGYGSVDLVSIALAYEVLSGATSEPVRPDEDSFFAQADQVRDAIWGL